MKLFVDTSSLVKRYIEEPGSSEIDNCFINADEIFVSSVTHIELTAALTRRYSDKSIDKQSYNKALKEFEAELVYFKIIPFSDTFENSAVQIIKKHTMKTLDAIQLSSALASKADQFITSDKRLFNIAKKKSALKCVFI